MQCMCGDRDRAVPRDPFHGWRFHGAMRVPWFSPSVPSVFNTPKVAGVAGVAGVLEWADEEHGIVRPRSPRFCLFV